MTSEGLTIAQAAKVLGVSSRTVRRFVKAGKIRAELLPGQFGDEYRIRELPQGLERHAQEADTGGAQSDGQTDHRLFEVVHELQEKNLALAAQLGAATERIRNLEAQVKLLAAPRTSWWRRLFGRKAA